MFKKKAVKKLPVEEVQYEESFPEAEIEDEEIEDEESEEEEIEEPTPKVVKMRIKKSRYTPGDIIPVNQIVGYQVIKSVDDEGIPSATSTEKLSEAEILSYIYRE